MNFLRKEFAPISEEAWKEINRQAKDTLMANLSSRKFVDVDGPKGLDFSAVSLGRLFLPKAQKGAVKYGISTILPLIEIRTPFSLGLWELDNIERGAKDINLDPLTEAAKQTATFEETAVYHGFKEGGISGINQLNVQKVAISLDKDSVTDAVTEALAMMRKEGVAGGANLVVNQELWKFLAHVFPGGTLGDTIKNQIGGSIIYSGFVDGAVLVSARGGDAELTVGQDFAIGYTSHDSDNINLFVTESFTFRVVNPEGFIRFAIQ
ncbi:MAG: family 1 encapsulin nanocompartment shell protein [Deferribacterales bacterium]